MENFRVYNPVNLHFGKGVLNGLAKLLKEFGQNLLLVYGQGSIKKFGYYDQIHKELSQGAFAVFEYSGIKPNPSVQDVREGVELCRKFNIDMILAVGGGSVIDTAKLISISALNNYDLWDLIKRRQNPENAIPLITVLTLAATGTEMNSAAVVQNPATREKVGFVHPLMFPRYSFLDPMLTRSVSPEYTAYGVVDLIAHAMEAFFGKGDAELTDSFIVEIIKNAIKNAPPVLAEPDNYNYRANVMLAATFALNGITSYGKSGGDWGVHNIGHTLSFLFDTPHGATLSLAYPAWLRLQSDKIADRIAQFGQRVFDSTSAESAITDLEAFFKSINSPIRLQEIGLKAEDLPKITDLLQKNAVSGYNHKLEKADYAKLVAYMNGDF